MIATIKTLICEYITQFMEVLAGSNKSVVINQQIPLSCNGFHYLAEQLRRKISSLFSCVGLGWMGRYTRWGS
jgi:hypothetical protein